MRKRYAPTARRRLIWARSQDLFQPPAGLPAAGTAVDLLAQFRADGGNSMGCTVTRVRLDIGFQINNPGAVNLTSQDQLAAGVIVDQIQANQAEVPRPGAEEHADWMYWRRSPYTTNPESAVPYGTGTAPVYHMVWTVDIKSQRKIEELGQTLWLVLDPSYSTGVPIVGVNANSSVLLRLP